MQYLGDRTEDSTIYIKWATNSSAGASITRATNGTISVYKDNNTTQSTAGITDTEDFDSLTGVHHITIDLSADAFYVVGSDYQVVLSAATIDGQTVNFPIASFSIEKEFNEVDVTKWLGQAVAAVTVNGVPEVDVTHFGGSAGTFASGRPEVNVSHAAGTAWNSGAIGANTLAADTLTAAKVASDVGTEIGTAVWATTTRLLTAGTNIALAKGTGVTGFNDLDAAGIRSAVGLASANLDSQLSTIDGIVDSILVDTAEIGTAGAGLTAVPWNASWDPEVQSECTDALNAYDPPTRAELTSDINSVLNILQGVVLKQGTIGSTGNDTTHLHLTGLTYSDDEINDHLLVIFDVSEGEYHARWVEDWANTGDLATVATLPFTPQNATDTYWLLPVRRDVTGGSGPSAADIADAVWEEAIADHSGTSGSTAEALNAAGSAGDPWVTNLPGAYGSGSAGYILGTNLNATVSSRATQTSVDDVPTNSEFNARTLASADYATAAALATADSVIDGIDARLPNDPADQSAVEAAITAATSPLATAANQTTILNRLGAFTGSGVNTVLGFLRALMRKDGSITTPSDVGGTFDHTTDSNEALRDRGDAAWLTATGFSTHNAADVWAVGTRSLTVLDEDSTTLDLDATIRAAVGLATASLDTQLGAIDDLIDTEVAAILAAVDTEVAAIKAKTDNLPAAPAAVGDIPSAATIVAAVFSELIETGYTFKQATRLIAAACAGKLSGAQTATETFRSLDDSANRITATVDSSGNRSAVTHNA